MPEVILQDVAKHYGTTVAVASMSLTIREGELVSLLGPSGCGKTTTLRMIGGFVDATAGRILVGGRDVTRLPPNQRNMGFVFQNYALFPHMTVAQNVAFGLEMRKVNRTDAAKQVDEALARVRLSKFADRYPRQLSGGQQQRVALARALVIKPDVLLLDEPLSNLDASLRHEMKLEIRNLQQSLGLTTVFVTHDQDEAMSTSDRMVLMYNGKVEQVGPPDEVYNQPCSVFAAGFLGIPNLLPGQITSGSGFQIEGGPLVELAEQKAASGKAFLALRPEAITISPAPLAGQNAVAARIEQMSFHGASVEYQARTTSGMTITARSTAPGLGGPQVLPTGAEVQLSWTANAGILIPGH